MKKFIFVIFAAILFFACQKQNDITPTTVHKPVYYAAAAVFSLNYPVPDTTYTSDFIYNGDIIINDSLILIYQDTLKTIHYLKWIKNTNIYYIHHAQITYQVTAINYIPLSGQTHDMIIYSYNIIQQAPDITITLIKTLYH